MTNKTTPKANNRNRTTNSICRDLFFGKENFVMLGLIASKIRLALGNE